MNPLANKYDIGVVVGRFQVPEISEGHKYLLDNVLQSHKQMIIAVGVSPALGTKKNPLGYTARMQMLQEAYPKAIVIPIMDVGSNVVWSNNLDTMIRSVCPIGSICLYGGRDSFINAYEGLYPTFELGVTDQKEGTKIREEVGKEVINSKDFRAGVIHATQNQYPKVFQTVDIAVIDYDDGKKKEKRVLMGHRHGSEKWRFPGGFVSPADASLEDAALRELGEELDVSVHPETIEYVSSHIMTDWRYEGPDEKIMTALYQVQALDSSTAVNEEFEETDWILLSPWGLPSIEANHIPLFEALLIKHKLMKKEEHIEQEEEENEESVVAN